VPGMAPPGERGQVAVLLKKTERLGCVIELVLHMVAETQHSPANSKSLEVPIS
jgi:hypothetical protein